MFWGSMCCNYRWEWALRLEVEHKRVQFSSAQTPPKSSSSPSSSSTWLPPVRLHAQLPDETLRNEREKPRESKKSEVQVMQAAKPSTPPPTTRTMQQQLLNTSPLWWAFHQSWQVPPTRSHFPLTLTFTSFISRKYGRNKNSVPCIKKATLMSNNGNSCTFQWVRSFDSVRVDSQMNHCHFVLN